MFTAAVIVFREIFEIAIIVCVILAATRQVAYRSYWVGGGIAVGAMIVAILACFAGAIANFATQMGEHFFNALVLFTAAALISWSVIWMQQHGRQISIRMKEVSLAVSSGQTPLYMLAIVTGLAVIREGSEIVLFLYGIYSTGDATTLDLMAGFILGLGLGCLTGVVMYVGLIRIPVKQLFGISSWLLAFLAAGMVAKGMGHLVKADIVPALMNPLWDTSALLSQRSVVGRFLSILLGYQDQPAGIQVIFYIATLALISLTLLPKKQKI